MTTRLNLRCPWFVTVAVLCAATAAIRAQVTESPAKTKEPLPAGQALETARQTVEEVYGDSIKNIKTPADAAKLADQLISVGLKTTGDDAGRFALYDAARRVAEKTGDLQRALFACGQIEQAYQVEGLKLKESAFHECAKASKRPAELTTLVEGGLMLIDEAIAADDYAVAQRLAAAAGDLARRSRQRDVASRAAKAAKRVSELGATFAQVREAKERLRGDPGHAASHTGLGRFLCFQKGDWEAGLAHLAQGDDAALQAIAKEDRALPEKPEDRLALGDKWLAEASRASPSERLEIEGRAGYWYRLALPGLGGLERLRAEKALKTLPETKNSFPWRQYAGQWRIRYANGAIRRYQIDEQGMVEFIDERRRGSLVRDGARIKLDFGEGKLETVRLEGDMLLVEHFNPASDYPDKPGLTARGTREGK